MGKRGNGEGSVYQRASDGKWCATIWVDGKRKPLYGNTQKEVIEKQRKAERDKDDGLPVITERWTVERYLQTWLTEVKQPEIRPTTMHMYRSLIEHHVVPRIGRTELRKLTPHQVQRLLNDAREGGLSPQTVGHIRAILRAAMNKAREWNLVQRNVVDVVKAPTIPKPDYVTLTPDQSRCFLQHAEGTPLGALYHVALLLGLRIGEILALRWQDIDIEKQRLHIRHTISHIDQTLHEPKTKTSNRRLPMPTTVVAQLQRHHIRQLERRLQAATLWTETDHVFTNDVGKPLTYGAVLWSFRQHVKAVGLPDTISLHDLRRACASLHASIGTPPRTVMEILGHTDLKTTMMIYTQVYESGKVEAVDSLDRFLRDAV